MFSAVASSNITWPPALSTTRAISSSGSRMPSARGFPKTATWVNAWVMRTIMQEPSGRARLERTTALQGPACGHNGSHARRSIQTTAQDADRALHRRRPAGRLARPGADLGARTVAGDHPERDGGPRGHGVCLQPAHLGRPGADAAWLPPLRRQPADRAAAGTAADRPDAGAAAGC